MCVGGVWQYLCYVGRILCSAPGLSCAVGIVEMRCGIEC